MRTTRRQFLKGGAAGVVTLALGRGLAGPSPDRRFLVVLNLIGGNDGLATVVPDHLAAYHERRGALVLPAAETLELDGGFRLHPALKGLQERWREGRLHVVHRVGYPQANQSHFKSQDIFATGVRQANQADGRGWLGRFADTYTADPLGVVAVGTGRRLDLRASGNGALVLNDVPGFRIQHDQDDIQDHLLRVRHARELLLRELPPEEPEVFLAERRAHELLERVQDGTRGWVDPGHFPATPLGARLKTVSQLLSGDFGTRVYYTALGGFDTHANQPERHGKLLAELDGALAAFARDLEEQGRWRDCAVLLISEFGRRNAANGSAGTDHGHANAFLVIGGAVQGGTTGDLLNAHVLEEQLPMRYDFREIYAHLLERHLGVDPRPVLPEPFARTGELSLIA